MVHKNIEFYDVYSYTVPENKWTKLTQCKNQYFAMAIINDALVTIGGKTVEGKDHKLVVTNTLLSLCGSSWKEVFPSMPTE